MSSLVEELQRDALSKAVDVSDLLRKAYVVATKLKLNEFKEWVNAELNGYEGDVPDYRIYRGVLRAWNPYNGWIPIMFESASDGNDITLHHERQTVGSLNDLVSQSEQGQNFIVHLTPRQQAWVQRGMVSQSGMRLTLEASLHISRSDVVRIIDAVRNVILEWSLKLEADGILGEGMSFSPTEKQIATEKADELQSVVNNITIHTMVNSTIQQGSAKARLKGPKRTG